MPDGQQHVGHAAEVCCYRDCCTRETEVSIVQVGYDRMNTWAAFLEKKKLHTPDGVQEEYTHIYNCYTVCWEPQFVVKIQIPGCLSWHPFSFMNVDGLISAGISHPLKLILIWSELYVWCLDIHSARSAREAVMPPSESQMKDNENSFNMALFSLSVFFWIVICSAYFLTCLVISF